MTGTWYDENKLVQGIFVNYFNDMFKTTRPAMEDIEAFPQPMVRKVSDNMNEWLLKKFDE